MSLRFVTPLTLSCLLAFALSGCRSSGGGSTGGGGGGGGGGSGLSISQLAPSSVTVGVSQGEVTVYGQGFTQQSQVFIDGQQAPLTTFTDSGTLQAELNQFFTTTAGTHQFSVQNGTQASNSLTFTIYAIQQGGGWPSFISRTVKQSWLPQPSCFSKAGHHCRRHQEIFFTCSSALCGSFTTTLPASPYA
jgi:hypothetical protein